ncbi:MAG: S9 family peptidase [Chitinophaga sp.]|uniref:alpha/beta hydrolase family protein n=1 Tax=Chitinophaga sp. TaxID=1869181 RepID=UPI001B1B5320|nr:prolyl oligopeptidase family serine peptidase [Chitinophaga sp.]MBO9727313.1 S9 family peptidase [Chitinophaga sp.]
MRFLSLLAFLGLVKVYSFAQKQPSKEQIKSAGRIDKLLIDSGCYNRWPVPTGAVLTGNGRFVYSLIENDVTGGSTWIIQATEGVWKREFYNIDRVKFTSDSKQAILVKADKIYLVRLGTSGLDSIVNVSSYQLSPDGKWLAYQQKGSEKKLVVQNINTNKGSSFLSVAGFFFGKRKDIIFMRRDAENEGGSGSQVLCYANIITGDTFNIYRGEGIRSVIFSTDGNNMSFIAKDKSANNNLEGIWYYQLGSDKPDLVLSGLPCLQCDSLKLNLLLRFSNDNNRLFVTLEDMKYLGKSIDPALPDVWSFNDRKLQSQQLLEDDSRTYNAIVDIQKKELFSLEKRDEIVVIDNQLLQDSIAILIHQQDEGSSELDWNMASIPTSCLISTKTGKRILINEISKNQSLSLSAFGRYVIYFDERKRDYFTYEIGTGIIRNVTKGINANWEVEGYRKLIEGWLQNDSGVVMNERNDIWLLDPTGAHSPVNLTNSYGRRKNIIFTLTWNSLSDLDINSKEPLFLTAFNSETKENGFFSANWSGGIDPVLLTMGPFIYDIPFSTAIPQGSSFSPVKAVNANAYIVRRMSDAEYPNLWFTKDFKKFRRLTNFQPQVRYNWYTAELHEWKSPDGLPLQGILYKPENFDSTRKYPVIFNYYERKSDGLRAFIMPSELSSGGNINIPYYVSNGYLVFCPDIKYTVGDPMQGAYNAIVSAVEHLSKLSFVDAKKMGLQGFSWGAIQTNYLITATNLFAAACSVSGIGDWISGFGSLAPSGISFQALYVGGQLRMGEATLWDKPEIYIKNSAVLNANRISTPILLAHTKDDGVCQLPNITELFTALRRLGKRSWMLVYPGDHGIEGKSGMDFSIRMAQFFDHYLKRKPAPIWMTKGVPAKLKGVYSGLDLDSSTNTPKGTLFIGAIDKTTN